MESSLYPLSSISSFSNDNISYAVPNDFSMEILNDKFPDSSNIIERIKDDDENYPFIPRYLLNGSWCLIWLILLIHILNFILMAVKYFLRRKNNGEHIYNEKQYADVNIATMAVSFTLLMFYVGVKYTIWKRQDNINRLQQDLEKQFRFLYEQHNNSMSNSNKLHKKIVENLRAKKRSNNLGDNSNANRIGREI